MNRRDFLRWAGGAAGTAAWAGTGGLPGLPARAAEPTAPDAPRPDIVFILADDLGRCDVGFMGSRKMRTPNLDKLAAAGTVLEHHYVQPVCSPTRSSLMTGRYPMRYGLQVGVIRPDAQYGLPLEERTLPQALREAGYTTAMCGKWHLGSFDKAYWPNARGFDHWYGHLFGMLDYFSHVREGRLDWYRNGESLKEEGYTTELLAAEAERIVARQPKDKPLFLYVPFNAVHSPHQVPPRYKQPFDDMPEPRRTYAAMIAAMDEAVGKIVAAVEAAGRTKNTLFVFSSDNGGPNPGKLTDNGELRAGKGTVYEGGTRVCAMACWPGHIPAGRSNAMLHMVDWYPTLLHLARAKTEQKLELDGLNAWAALAEGKPSPRREVLHNANPAGGAVRVGDWKLVVHTPADEADADDKAGEAPKAGKKAKAAKKAARAARCELYNLAADPSEKNDLSATEPEKLKELRQRYDAYASKQAKPKNKE